MFPFSITERQRSEENAVVTCDRTLSCSIYGKRIQVHTLIQMILSRVCGNHNDFSVISRLFWCLCMSESMRVEKTPKLTL